VNGYLQVNGAKYKFSSIGQSDPTVSQFVSWVNGLGAGVTASFDGSKINLNNSQTNGSNSIDLSGVTNSVSRTTVSLAAMGMDIQLDGTIQFNTASYQQAASKGLYGKLAKGLKMGFSGNGSSLDAFITSEIDPAKGALVQQIATQQSSVTDLQKRQANLQDHLNQVQNNYITQYSALNALLFQLNSTSTSLASALAAVTNINAGK
jgi:arsenate reductase-like glutaredoxin family protein